MGGPQAITVTSTAATAWSTWGLIRNRFNVSVYSTASWDATVYLQRKFGDTGTTMDVDTFTADVEATGIEPEDDVYYRIGIGSTYTSGKVHLRVSQ
jgi:hypothetical protein